MLKPAFLTAALFSLFSSPCPAQSFSLSGYVIDGQTNRPLSKLRVHLYDFSYKPTDALGSNGPAAAPATTDSEGHFAFTGLSASRYALQAELPHAVISYAGLPDPIYRHFVDVGPATENQVVLFRILSSGALTGRIRNEYGQPVEYAGISVYRLDRRGGRIALSYAARSGTDDLGHYSVGDLWPGDYAVCAEPPSSSPDYFLPAPEAEAQYRPGGDSRVYTRVCDGDPDSQAARLHIAAGAQVRVDLTLGSARSFPLRVSIPSQVYREDDPFPVPQLTSHIFVGNGFEYPNVAPGHYELSNHDFDRNRAGTVARREITVSDQAPQPVDLVRESRATIDVRLHSMDGRPLPAGAASISFIPISPRLLYDRFQPDRPDLSFALDPGTYWLSLRPKKPLCVASASLNGQSIMARPITVTAAMSARLDLELDTHCGVIHIHTLSDGSPAPFANVLLLLSGTPADPGDVITGGTDAHGQFSISSMAPARYLLWAWSSDGDGYLGPNLAEAARDAVEVVVTAGQSSSVSISPIHPPGSRR